MLFPGRMKTSMKMTKSLFGILTITLALAVQMIRAQSFLTNGLVAYWPFDGNANDASGSGNNGTVNGSTLATDRFGNLNSAYSFDGMSSIITVPASSQFDATNHTLSLWVKANSWTTRASPASPYVDLIGKDASLSAPREWVIQGTTSGNIRSAVFTSTGEHTFDTIQ